MNYLHYKGYRGSVAYSEVDHCLFGKVLGLTDSLILYEGSTLAELKRDFEAGIDHYLDDCAEEGMQPEIPHKLSFVPHASMVGQKNTHVRAN